MPCTTRRHGRSEGFDTSLAEGVLLMTPFSADDEKNADFGDSGRQVYRRLSAHKTLPVRLFYSGRGRL
ncbi:hypothetical protein DWV20_04750 [Collinsella sp. AF02-46-1]|nr:hypothetical protein DWV20_04750 [Collinsella sp. AF02-46-1]